MSRRTGVIGAVMILIGLPAVLAFGEAAAFHIRNRNNGTIVSSGETREYLLYVPRGLDRSTPAPLVISMHGAAGWPALQSDMSGWNDLADREGLMVVYPAGVEGDGARVWRVGSGSALAKDVRFISDLIDALQSRYNIDPERIYANGLSNGGGMSFVLSCELAGRIAAVGMVSSAQTLPWSWCTERRAVPMIAFHGTADPITRYHGGRSWIGPHQFPDIPMFVATWARRNGCAPDPVESTVTTDVTRRDYSRCTGGAAVVLYTLENGGHSWPGAEPLPEWFAGPTNNNIDATEEMWKFFRAHKLR